MESGNKYRPIGISNTKTYQIRTVSKTAVNKRNKKYIKQTVHIHSENGYRTFRPGSVSARKKMNDSAKSMDDSAKKDERFGQER